MPSATLSPQAAPVAAGLERVLLVDDDPVLLRSLSGILRRHFHLTSAVGPQEALARLQSDGPFAVVISDYWMVPTNGLELLAHFRRLHPETVCILLTGDATLTAPAGLFCMLEKPCSRDALRTAVAAALAESRNMAAAR